MEIKNKKIKISNLTKGAFIKLVEIQENEKPSLGIKKIEALSEYEFIDRNGIIIKYICNEK